MRTASLLIAAYAVFAAGCTHNLSPTPVSNGRTVAALNETANDSAAAADERCISVFTLFRQFIKQGSTPQELHEVLTQTGWLERTNLHGIYFLGGWIPVEGDFQNDTRFVVSILPAIKPSTGRPPNLGYHIYFTLSGGASRSEESAFAILAGREPFDRKARLVEFALYYPDGTIERVSKRGVQKFNQFSQARSNQPIQPTGRRADSTPVCIRWPRPARH